MKENVKILIAEDDDGHYSLIEKNLKRVGINNEIVRFVDGQETLDYLFRESGEVRQEGQAFLLLLDINMPKVDGVEVLKKVKEDSELSKIPVIMLTTSDDDEKTQQCRDLGCTAYIVKPVEYDNFVATIGSIGLFLSVVVMPEIEKIGGD